MIDEVIVRAPGRVNLIGGHTDYNDGYVLPVAIDREIKMKAKKRKDKWVKVYSEDFAEKAEFNLDDIRYNHDKKWINYIQGVAFYIKERDLNLEGVDIEMKGNVPIGAGLSSSAALEVAAACVFNKINKLNLKPIELAKISQKAENNFVGVKCGIMDQFVSSLGQKNKALFIDCQTNEYQLIPFRYQDIKIVVIDSRVKHNLADSAYNRRQEECQSGVDFFASKLNRNINSLRDVTEEEFKKYKIQLPQNIKKRCQHVIEENKRVLSAVEALKNNDIKKLGKLITASHYSLKENYEVSSKELDLLVNLSLEAKGVLGARMTGAGFGGSIISLVENKYIDSFKEHIKGDYKNVNGFAPDIYVCNIEDGCRVIEED